MTFRYLLALAVVALLAVGTFAVGQRNIARERDHDTQINVAGRQRMLSQRIALFSLQRTMVDSQARATTRAELLDAIDLMERSHEGLISGDADLGLPGNPSAGSRAILFESPAYLDTQVRAYLATARAAATAKPADLAPLEQRLNTMAPELLLDLDAAVTQYLLDTESDQRSHAVLDAIALGATAVALVVMALFVFQPMVRRVRRETGALETLSRSLEQRVAERTEELTAATETLARDAEERSKLAEIGRIVSSSLDIEQIYQQFVAQVRKLIPADRIAICRIDPGAGTFTTMYATGVEVAARAPGIATPLEGSLTARVISRRRGLIVGVSEDPAALANELPGLAAMLESGIRSFL